jgi:hypothetical protein
METNEEELEGGCTSGTAWLGLAFILFQGKALQGSGMCDFCYRKVTAFVTLESFVGGNKSICRS